MGNKICAKPQELKEGRTTTKKGKNESSANLLDENSIVSLSDFKIVKLIGQGGFGKVYLVKRQGTSTHYAMKVLRKDFIMQQDQFEHIMTERQILAQVRSPFIVDMQFAFQTDEKLYLVMEFVAGGELLTYISTRK